MKALAVSQDAQILTALQNQLRSIDATASLDVFQGQLAGQATLPAKEPVDVLLLDCSGADAMEELRHLERLAALQSKLDTLLLIRDDVPDVLLQAIRLGVKEVVRLPIKPDELAAAIRRIDRKGRQSSATPGRILSFISCKGGSGATFVAANLAYAIAARSGANTLLIDLNLQFGDAALYLSERNPAATLADVTREIDRMDAAFLKASLVELMPNFGVLAAPEDPAQAAEIRPAQVEALIRFARTQYDFVLLDVGRSLDRVSVQALDMSDQIYPILQMTLPFIRDGKRLMNVFRSLDYSTEKIRPIVNRFEKSPELTTPDLERALGVPLYANVPNHYRSAATSVNQGVPIERIFPSSPISKSLRALADKVVTAGAPAKNASWLQRILQR